MRRDESYSRARIGALNVGARYGRSQATTTRGARQPRVLDHGCIWPSAPSLVTFAQAGALTGTLLRPKEGK